MPCLSDVHFIRQMIKESKVERTTKVVILNWGRTGDFILLRNTWQNLESFLLVAMKKRELSTWYMPGTLYFMFHNAQNNSKELSGPKWQ